MQQAKQEWKIMLALRGKRSLLWPRLLLPLLLPLLLVLAGCSQATATWGGLAAAGEQVAGSLQQMQGSQVANNDVPTPQPTLDLATASTNRLLVQGIDGNLFTIAPDGTARLELTDDASRGWIYTQPTWSATGQRVAWSAIQRAGGDNRSALMTASADGTERTRTATLFPAFYLYWSPDDSAVAYLSNWLSDDGPSIALQVVDVAGGGERAAIVDVGQPYYFSWSADSQRAIAHVNNQQVKLLDMVPTTTERAEPRVLVDGSANFAAPQWFAAADSTNEPSTTNNADTTDNSSTTNDEQNAGNQLLYVIDDANTAQLVLGDAGGEEQEFITYLSRQDFVSFNMNATGSQIAYIETTEMIGFNSFGPLFVYSLEDEIFEQLSTAPTVAFFWSPAGDALLFLTVELAFDRPWLRINIWDGEEVRQYERFIPSPSFLRDYLRFADQYMQSMRFWSPDGSAVVYTGQAENGSSGIWVQPIQGDAMPELVAAGTFATWSPR